MTSQLTPAVELRGTPGNQSEVLVLSTPHVYVEYRPAKKEIFARDLDDLHNEPACYTKLKRGIKNTWTAVQATVAARGDATTHRDVMNAFSQTGMRYHYWCMMD